MVEEETPAGGDLDDAGVNVQSLFAARATRPVARHHYARPQVQLGHGVTKRGRFPLPGLRVCQGFAHLDQRARTVGHASDEVHFPAGPGPIVENVGSDAAERHEYQIFEQMAGIDQNSGRNRSHQCVVDAVDLLGVRVGAGEGCVEEAYREHEEGILEPVQIVRNRRLRRSMTERFQVAREPVDGIQRRSVVNQPVGQVRGRTRMGDVMALDEIAEQHRTPVLLVGLDS